MEEQKKSSNAFPINLMYEQTVQMIKRQCSNQKVPTAEYEFLRFFGELFKTLKSCCPHSL